MIDTAAERARRRVRDEMEREKLSQTDISGRLQWSQSRVSKVLHGRVELTVNDLESLCFAVGIPITEAVRDHGLEFCAEMSPGELRFLERFRQISAVEREALMVLFNVNTKTRMETRHARAPKEIIPKGRR